MSRPSKYKLVSLFSGAGGLDLGFHMRGNFKVVLANELLEAPAKTYSLNFGADIIGSEQFNSGLFNPPVVVNADIEKLDFSILEELKDDVDVVVGGPPCQDFSVLRGSKNRRGIEVKRGRLYAHFVRALIYLRPKVFVFENVPGLKSSNNGLAFKVITEDFRKLYLRWDDVKNIVTNGAKVKKGFGYELVFSEIVNMVNLGVPQQRRRLIIIGVRKDVIEDLATLWSISHLACKVLCGKDKLFHKYPLTPIEVFEGKPLTELQNEYEETMLEYEPLVANPISRRAEEWVKAVWNQLTFDIVKDYVFFNSIRGFSEDEFELAMEQHEEVLKLLNYYNRPVDEVAFPDGTSLRPREKKTVLERMKRIPPGENYEFVEGTEWAVKGLMSNIYRRVNPLVPSPTVIAYGGGGTWGYHYKRSIARLSNRERARLQTFPDWFSFVGNVQEVRAQIGEAVPPLASYAIAKVVEDLLSKLW